MSRGLGKIERSILGYLEINGEERPSKLIQTLCLQYPIKPDAWNIWEGSSDYNKYKYGIARSVKNAIHRAYRNLMRREMIVEYDKCCNFGFGEGNYRFVNVVT